MLESLPTLENCKSSCAYSMSTVYDETELPVNFIIGPVLSEAESFASLYFTPPGQLSPQGPPVRTHGTAGRTASYTKMKAVENSSLEIGEELVANPGPSYIMKAGPYVPTTASVNSKEGKEPYIADTQI